VKLAFDTSVLVAALIDSHPHHLRASPWVAAVSSGEVEAEITWHAVAEAWSVLTRLPGPLRLPPSTATIVIERASELFQPVDLTPSVYRSALRRCTEAGAGSGAVFDALHLISAEERGADGMVTFNRNDFERLKTGGSPEIVVPPDPPAFTLPT